MITKLTLYLNNTDSDTLKKQEHLANFIINAPKQDGQPLIIKEYYDSTIRGYSVSIDYSWKKELKQIDALTTQFHQDINLTDEQRSNIKGQLAQLKDKINGNIH